MNIVTFEIGDRLYGIDLRSVGEVLTLGSVTRVPLTPAFVIGVLNARGTIAALVDLPWILAGQRAEFRAGDSGIWLAGDGEQLVAYVGRVGDVLAAQPLSEDSTSTSSAEPLVSRKANCEHGEVSLVDIEALGDHVFSAVSSRVGELGLVRGAYPAQPMRVER
ncbi:MAG: chemotaxis protein CheW [Deltaproteobacteria bacterium]|nr:chemotaxis protein CheW [Deltaproteobacteria bacterium]